MLRLLVIAGLVASTPALADQTPAAQVEAAERAFAADGLAFGVRDSFLKHMAAEAIIFRPGPVSAKAFYEKRPSSKAPRLEWWPAKVVAARSGDLALSVGPWAVDGKRGGYYATIWRKTPDQGWKWIYDGGGDADPSAAPGPETPALLGTATAVRAISSDAGFEGARLAEQALAAAAEHDAPGGYRGVLTADAWLLGPSGTEVLTPFALDQRLQARPARMMLTMAGGGASKDGDFVWTHGEAAWADHAEMVEHAHYMHVWQRRPEGWRLIFETLINDP